MPPSTTSHAGAVLSMGEVLIDFIATDGATALEHAGTFAARAGGAPANVTVALARLGLASAFCGVIGADPFGARLRAELQAEGVNVSRLRSTPDFPTTLAYAWKDGRGDGHFWLLRGADTTMNAEDANNAGIPTLEALVVGSVSLAEPSSRAAIERAAQIARDSAVPVVFDVNFRPAVWKDPALARPLCEQLFAQSRLAKLSLDDAVGLFGQTSPEAAIRRIAAAGPASVVLTDGERGCWFWSNGSAEIGFVPAYRVTAVEPTGAGDAFSAGLIARLLGNTWAPLTVADVRYAAAAGALATTRPGAWDGLPTRPQLDAFLHAV